LFDNHSPGSSERKEWENEKILWISNSVVFGCVTAGRNGRSNGGVSVDYGWFNMEIP
jgi:hypothetical protein